MTSTYIVPMTKMADFVKSELQKVEDTLNNHLHLSEAYDALVNNTIWFSESGGTILDHVTSVVDQALNDIENFVSEAILLVERAEALG